MFGATVANTTSAISNPITPAPGVTATEPSISSASGQTVTAPIRNIPALSRKGFILRRRLNQTLPAA